jgi:hypothetical protein
MCVLGKGKWYPKAIYLPVSDTWPLKITLTFWDRDLLTLHSKSKFLTSFIPYTPYTAFKKLESDFSLT